MLTTLVMTLALMGQAPAPKATTKAAPRPTVSASHQTELQKTVAARKARKLKQDASYRARLKQEAAEAKAQREYEIKMAPIIAKAQKDAADLAIRQQTANAMSGMAGAMQQEAVTDRRRLNMQAARGGGMVSPYGAYIPGDAPPVPPGTLP